MCGIGGHQTFAPGTAPDYLACALEAQHSRGPDGRGTFVSEDQLTGLSHNRLAILDLSDAGAQPMHSQDKNLTIIFNGEIYNWRELRSELSQYGFQFTTGSDTEVLLAAYRHWGKSFFSHLNGMYAFAIYDAASKELFLARDRIGKKPLVYTETPNGFFFASELPALLRALPSAPELNRNAIITSLVHNLRHIPEPHTPWQGIHKLRPGHAMMVKSGRVQAIWRHYDPLEGDQGPTTADQLRELLDDAVERRMVADVPVSALLSGGVDSTAITALMQKKSVEAVKTYALGLNAEDEDLRRARVMAERIGTQHREFYFDSSRQWEVMGELLRYYGEPIAIMPLTYAAELFRHIHADGGRVVLMGHGADELFYGYNGHWRTLMVSLALQYGCGLGAVLPGNIGALSRARSGARKAALYQRHSDHLAHQILTKDSANHFQETVSPQMEFWGEFFSGHNYLDESNFIGLMIENQHSITIAADLPAMMHSVESRCPFLDWRIMQFAWRTHWWQKLVPGKYHEQKYILRRAVADLMPPEILSAPKRGFGFGIGIVELMTNHWRSQVEELLLSNEQNDIIGLDNQKIENLWQQSLRGDSNAASLAFKLLNLKRWLREVAYG